VTKHSVEITAGQRLKQWLDAEGSTQRQMASRLGITDAHMSSIIRGVETPGLSLAVKIENLTGIPPRAWAEVAA
jgi:transcriptional regulator with XRE-family HTH domain